jgi:lambda family phage portal protein
MSRLGARRLRADSRPVRPRAELVRSASASYEAGASTRRTLGWNAPTTTPNSGVLSNLSTLRDRSRAAVRNDGFAKHAIDELVSNIVGTGIQPLSQAEDPTFRQGITKLWTQWTDQADASGRLSWEGLQAQICRAWKEGGEVFALLRERFDSDGLVVPLQVEVVEPEMCPHTYSYFAGNNRRIRAGIEFNRIGRRTGYWFHPSRPEFDDWDTSTLKFWPADRVIHVYTPDRPGQLRGVPQLVRAVIKFLELDKFDDATLLRQQLANLFVAFLTRQPGVSGTDFHPLTGEAIDDARGEKPVLKMEPGIFQELEPGEEVAFSEPPDVGSTYPEFMRQQLLGAAVAAGVPYEVLSGDMSKINDRTVRVVLHGFRRRIEAEQHNILGFQLCRQVWNAFVWEVAITGKLPVPDAFFDDPTPWNAVTWQPQRFPYIHPVQDVQAKVEEIRSGLTSRSAAVREMGEDAEEIDAQQAADNDRADRLKLSYDSDARRPKNAAPTEPAPATTDPAEVPA